MLTNITKPRKLVQKEKYSDFLKKLDSFEQRYEPTGEYYYLFNPFTGETINQTGDFYNRALSTWAPTEKPSKVVTLIELFPMFYASRSRGRRKIIPIEDEEDAATRIEALARGWLARRTLQQYYRSRYLKVLDINSGYYYFHDTWDPNAPTFWHKPTLAFPTDIGVYDPATHDPQEFMKGDKYTYRAFTKGPFLKLAGIGKLQTARAQHGHFHNFNPVREVAVVNPEDLDLDQYPIHSIVPLIDGHKLKEVLVSDYMQMRTACVNNNWASVYRIMRMYPERTLTQIYGMHCFSKIEILLDASGALIEPARQALRMCYDVILRAISDNISPTLVTFTLRALYHFISTHSGRGEFFELTNEEGKSAAAEREAHKRISKRLAALGSILDAVQTERVELRLKQAKGYVIKEYYQPTPRGVEIAQYCLLNIATLAHNLDNRELVAAICCDPVVAVLKKCPEDLAVMTPGLICLYNFCYRCEAGQELVRQARVQKIIALCRKQFPGDFDVQRQTRRLELALVDDGWRGNVESIIDQEFYGIDTTQTLATMSALLGGGDTLDGTANSALGGVAGGGKISRGKISGFDNRGAGGKDIEKTNALTALDYLDHKAAKEGKDQNDKEMDDDFVDIHAGSVLSEFTEMH